jgi:glycosyltransferase involved in cell wall biosynthesis
MIERSVIVPFYDERDNVEPQLATGLAATRGEIVATLDGDGQKDPADIPKLLAALVSAVAGWISLRAYRRRHPGEEPAAGRRPSWAAIAVIVALALLAAGALAAAGHAISLPRRFRTVESGALYRGACPAPAALHYVLNHYGIRTVVNLCAPGDRPHPSRYPDEPRICRERGVAFLNLEMPPDTPPTPEQQAAWLALFRNPARTPVFVHCEHGIVRTGMMVALFQVAFQGLTGEEAWRRLPQFGHDFMKPERDDVRDFIRRYSPPPPPPSDR